MELNLNPFTGNASSLPPRGPSPSVNSQPSLQALLPLNNNNAQPQRPMPRSSSTISLEEQPSWLDELLNEPETPVKNRGHRRSASDPFAHVDANNRVHEFWLRNITEGPCWGFQRSHQFLKDKQGKISHEQRTGVRKTSLPNSAKEEASSSKQQKQKESAVNNNAEDIIESSNLEGNEGSCYKSPPPSQPASRNESKRAKQHNARRSRVRKLQYIAELERNVQTLQLEGSQVSAQLEFLDQQNLILGMENQALKQRLESVSQEQVIKSLEQEILERELGRLQYLYHKQNLHLQQQQRRPPNIHRRAKSWDVESHFANLDLQTKEVSCPADLFIDSGHWITLGIETRWPRLRLRTDTTRSKDGVVTGKHSAFAVEAYNIELFKSSA